MLVEYEASILAVSMVIRLLQEFLQIYLECLSCYKFYVSLAKEFWKPVWETVEHLTLQNHIISNSTGQEFCTDHVMSFCTEHRTSIFMESALQFIWKKKMIRENAMT